MQARIFVAQSPPGGLGPNHERIHRPLHVDHGLLLGGVSVGRGRGGVHHGAGEHEVGGGGGHQPGHGAGDWCGQCECWRVLAGRQWAAY